MADQRNHRVLVWTPVPATSGEPADAALGQDNLTTSSFVQLEPRQNRIGWPEQLAVAGGYLFVADSVWNRVLRFQLTP